MRAKFEAIHADLGGDFYDEVAPASFPKCLVRYRNDVWSERIGLGDLSQHEWQNHFATFVPFEASFPKPLALRYHGHQFHNYNSDLGDGRGFLFAQLRDLKDNRLLDLGTKGSGQTPWSRQGDGRLTLKGGVREILATAMLEALGVNTSKTLSLIETGEALMRGDEPSPTRSSVLVRLSHSHIRIGSFQRQAALENTANIEKLLDHSVKYYMPDLAVLRGTDRIAAFLTRVAENVAQTGAAWTAAGFVHGVLNTDNINITGESFDYGPWRFLPTYDSSFTAAYFDSSGLYAFGRQPEALVWNIARLAECFLPLAPKELLEDSISAFWPKFQSSLGDIICQRLGITAKNVNASPSHLELVKAFIGFMEKSQIPFEQAFFDLRGGVSNANSKQPLNQRLQTGSSKSAYGSDEFKPLLKILLEDYQTREKANQDHAYFQQQKPCTMLIDEVETIWNAIAETDDWSLLEKKLEQIAEMPAAYDLAKDALKFGPDT